jgi:hypothetical protein
MPDGLSPSLLLAARYRFLLPAQRAGIRVTSVWPAYPWVQV